MPVTVATKAAMINRACIVIVSLPVWSPVS